MLSLSSLSRMGLVMGDLIGNKCSGVEVGRGDCNVGEIVGATVGTAGGVGFKWATGKWAVEGMQAPGCYFRWCSFACKGLS